MNDVSDQAMEVGRQSGIQVIARSAAIMRALGKNPQGLSLASIAQLVDLPRSTVQRIINALQDELLVEPMGPGGGFRLGPALGHLLNQSQCDIITQTRPLLVELANRLRESVCLCRRSGDQVHVIERIVAERELRVVLPIGAHGPVCKGASGKLLLAMEPPAGLQHLLPAEGREALLEELAQLRAAGWAAGFDEFLEGVSSFSVVADTYMGLFAVTVVAPTARAQVRLEEFRAALLDCKQAIERAIGRDA